MTEEAIREPIPAQRLPDPDGVLVARLASRALTEATGAQILDEAVVLIRERLGVDAVMLLEQVPTGEGFTMRAGTGWTQTAKEIVVPRLPGSQVDYISRQSDVVRIPNLPNERRFRPMPFLLEHDIKSSLSCPIRTDHGVNGILSAHTRTPREYTTEEAAFLSSVSGVVTAIFERRDTEAALAESEERFRMALTAGGMGAWEWRIQSGEVIWSEELERIHGLQPGTFGGTFEDYQSDMHPDDRARVLESVRGSLDTGSHAIEYRIILPDGEERWLSARGQLIRDPEGRPLRMIGVCTDNTQVKRAAEERERAAATLARSNRQQAAVAQLGLYALSAANIQELMDEAVASLSATLEVKYAKVLELLPDDQGLLLKSGVGWHEGLVGNAIVSTGPDSQAAYALNVKEPVVVTNLKNETRFRGTQMLHNHGVVSGISITIRLSDRPYGVLGAHTTHERQFTEDEINFLQAVANILAAAVERHEHSQEQQRLVFQLELERQRVDNLMANVPGVVWEAYGQPDDSTQRIDFVSDYVEEMLGYTVDEWLAKPNFWLTIVHPDDRERAGAEAAQIYTSGEPGRSEFRWLTKDANVVWVEAHSAVISDAEGNPVGMRGVTMDITSRRQADNRLREYAWTLETINRINLALSRELNLELIVQQVTEAAARLASAEVGWFVYTLAEDDQAPAYRQYTTSGEGGSWAETDDSEGVRRFLDLLSREGIVRCDDAAIEERCTESIAYLNRSANLTIGGLVAVPVTARTPGARGVLVLAHSAKGIFSERAEQISVALAAQATIAIDNALQFQESQRLLEDLRLANEAKDEFLGLISHELRTPITTIFGGARLLRSRGDKLDEESRRDVLEDIERESDRLHRIVEDLLVLARLELGQEIAMEPVLLRRVAERTIWSFSRRRAGRPIELQMDTELSPVFASATYMEQILRNLITNADKYSPPGEPIDIWVRRQGDEVIVSVMDRGPGLPPDEMGLIFERFYRSSGTSSQASGAGIGLTVCRRLMTAQGGRIWAEARDGGGLNISFALPLYDEPGPD